MKNKIQRNKEAEILLSVKRQVNGDNFVIVQCRI